MEEVIKIIRIVSRQWLLLIVAPLITMGIIYELTKNQPRVYKSEAKLYLNLQENQATSLNGEGIKQYQIHTYFQNITELVTSNRTLARTKLMILARGLNGVSILALGLPDDPTLLDSMRNRVNELQNGSLFPRERHGIDSLIINYFEFHKLNDPRLTDMVSSYRLRDSNYLGFSVEEEMAIKAQVVAECFIEALIEENKYLAKNQIKGQKTLLEDLLRKAKADLDEKVGNLEQYKIDNSIINLGEHTKAIVTYLVEIEGQRAKLYSNIAGSQKGKSEVLQTAATGNALTIDLSQNAEIVELKEQLKALNRESLLASLEKNNLDVMPEIEARIESTKNQLSEKIYQMSNKLSYDPTRIQLELANRYLAYDLDEEMSADVLNVIDEEIARVQTYAKKFAPYESTIGTMDREISTAQNAYLTLLNKLNVAQSMEYGTGENEIEVIDPPSYPEKPQSSKRIIIILAGGIAVFAMIAGAFIVMTLLDKSVNTVTDYERKGTFHIIGAIPNKKQLDKHDATSTIHDQQIIALSRSVRAYATNHGNVILLVSSTGGTGKSYLAQQMRKALHSSDYKVAVVNASPDTEYVDGQIDMRAYVDNHSILRNEATMLKELEEIRQNNDLVLIQTPPSDQSADINVWLEEFPHFLYLFKAGRIFSKTDERLEALLHSKQTHNAGAVLCQTNIEDMEDLIGEVPKNRGLFRIWVKKFLTRNLQVA